MKKEITRIPKTTLRNWKNNLNDGLVMENCVAVSRYFKYDDLCDKFKTIKQTADRQGYLTFTQVNERYPLIEELLKRIKQDNGDYVWNQVRQAF